MAFHDPVRLSFEGDRVAAAKYIRPARALLHKLARETSAHADQARRRFVLPDGAVIEIELAGLQTMVHIIVPEGGGGRVKVIEHFVIWARTEELPDGIDIEHPQQMLRYENSDFTTLFYDPGIDGYEDFPRTKGTYRTDREVVAFPDGVRHAGNVDWVNPEGVRISWYGPSTRYFLDAYVQPRSQYGTKVFMLGQELFDSDAYMAASDVAFPERWVMGAALSPDLRTLYVVHADLPVGTTLTGQAPARAIETVSPFPESPVFSGVCDVSTVVASYALVRDRTVEDVMNFSVVPESRAVIASAVLPRALNPWFFNGSGTAAVSSGILLRQASLLGTSMGTVLEPPSPSNEMFLFTNGAIQTSHVSALPGGSAALAADFVGDQMIELTVRRWSERVQSSEVWTDNVAFGIGDTAWEVQSTRMTGAGYAQQALVHRALVWADLRAGTAVFVALLISGTIPTNVSITMQLEVWHGPVLVKTVAMNYSAIPAGTGLPRQIANATLDGIWFLNQVAQTAVAPSFYLYGQLTRFTGIISSVSFSGRIWTYWTTPFPQADMFGHYSLTGPVAGPRNPILSTANFSSTATDFDGKVRVLGAASYEGVTVFSGHDFGTRGGAALHAVAAPEGAFELPQLSGVDGTKPRYHPIWLLGMLPSREVQ